MMRQKLLHRMKGMCGATSRMMKDELIVGKHQVDGTRLFIYVTVPGKRDHLGNFFKIELLLPQGRVGFELQNALHI